MTPIENLARDICWAENRLDHKNARATKASFWKSLDADVQEQYFEGARWLVFIVKALKPLRVLMMVDFPATPPPMGGRRIRSVPAGAGASRV